MPRPWGSDAIRSVETPRFHHAARRRGSRWPFAARAQQAAKLPTIGFLGQSTPAAEGQRFVALVQRLRELGWIEARTIGIEVRWAEGRPERAAEIAAEFVRLKVDVIVTVGTPQIAAAKQATSVIPIVFAAAGDPVGTGLVASLARPGGNVTGLSVLSTDLAGKRIELLREAVPGLRRLAILGNASDPVIVQEMSEFHVAAALGLEAAMLEIRRAEDIAPAFEALKAARKHFMSVKTCSRSPIGFASTHWRLACACRRCTRLGRTWWTQEV